VIDVVEVTLFRVRKELVHEFETSSHTKNFIEHVLVKATTADGRVGWGEAASPSDPYYCYENTDTCWHVLRHYLVPTLLTGTFETPAHALRASPVTGHPFAHAASDMVMWDLYSQGMDLPLADALGGTHDEVSAGVSLGIESSIDDLLEVVARHVRVPPGQTQDQPDLGLRTGQGGARGLPRRRGPGRRQRNLQRQ
jgi:O-succinylbenzoate synthase